MKADLLRIDTMSSLEVLSRVASSLNNELSAINDVISKLEQELNSRTKNPKWYNYSLEYDLTIYRTKKDDVTFKLSEIDSIIDDMLQREDVS